MDPIQRTTLVDRTVEALVTELRTGKWTGQLPGVRVLCAALKVSPPTLQAATARLVEQGVLVSRGARRKLGIADGRLKSRKNPAPGSRGPALKRIVCLTQDTLETQTHIRLEMLTLLRQRKHWDVRHRVMAFEDAKAPHRQWDQLLKTEQPDHLIIFKGTPVLAAWACTRGVPAVFIGGYAGDHPIPTVGFALRPVVQDAISELMRLGHRDICMPLAGVFPELRQKLREDFRQIMDNAGLPYDEAWNTPASTQQNAEVIWNALTGVFARRRPTAIICHSANDFIAVQSFLAQRRLRIPEDVSIIVFFGGLLRDWFRPLLTHYTASPAAVIRTVQGWIDKGAHSLAASIAVTPRLVRGGSVGPPRKG